MNSGVNKAKSSNQEISVTPEVEQGKIDEVRKLIGPLPDKLSLFCTDACVSRYLRARNWHVKKATKMLKASLKWRLEYMPEKIRWEDVASEAETGKIYSANYKDKFGRTVLVMRPRCQNTKSIKGQIKYLVYCMENAIINLPADQEQMVWLIDFHGFTMSNISVMVTKETAHVLQEHYPERLGVAILYDAPKMFEPFWKMVKPFLEPKTANKVKFAYSDNPNTKKILEDLFDMDQVGAAFGGTSLEDFDITKYAEKMKEDDKKVAAFWKLEVAGVVGLEKDITLPVQLLEDVNLDSDDKVDDEASNREDAHVEEENKKLAAADDSLPVTDNNAVKLQV